jgi:hypothetical protein
LLGKSALSSSGLGLGGGRLLAHLAGESESELL